MSDTDLDPEDQPSGEFLLYETDDGRTRVECPAREAWGGKHDGRKETP